MLFFFPKFKEFAHNLVHFLVNMAIILTQQLSWPNKAVFLCQAYVNICFRLLIILLKYPSVL